MKKKNKKLLIIVTEEWKLVGGRKQIGKTLKKNY